MLQNNKSNEYNIQQFQNKISFYNYLLENYVPLLFWPKENVINRNKKVNTAYLSAYWTYKMHNKQIISHHSVDRCHKINLPSPLQQTSDVTGRVVWRFGTIKQTHTHIRSQHTLTNNTQTSNRIYIEQIREFPSNPFMFNVVFFYFVASESPSPCVRTHFPSSC